MQFDNNTQAFFALVKAGLWEQNVRLSQYNNIDHSAIMRMAEEQSIIGLVTAGLEIVSDVKIQKEVYASTFPHCSMKSSEYLWPKTKRLVKDERRSKSKLRVCA